MGAGKTNRLLQLAKDYERIGRSVTLFVPEVAVPEKFTGQSCFIHKCRMGIKFKAEVLSDETLANGSGTGDIIIVDEAQFLTAPQVGWLIRYSHLGKKVHCFGLYSDYFGTPFDSMAQLLAFSTESRSMSALCACGGRATMNVRSDVTDKNSTKPRVDVGATYQTVCVDCFLGHWNT